MLNAAGDAGGGIGEGSVEVEGDGRPVQVMKLAHGSGLSANWAANATLEASQGVARP